MTEITVSETPLTISAGARVYLTADQAQRRAHAIDAVRENGDPKVRSGRVLYEVAKPIQFKVGETIIYEGDVKKLPRHNRGAASPAPATGESGDAGNGANGPVRRAAKKRGRKPATDAEQ